MLKWINKINLTLLIALIGGIPGLFQVWQIITDKPVLKGEILHFIAGDIGGDKGPEPIRIGREEFPTSLLIYFYLTNYKNKPVLLLNTYQLYIKTNKKTVQAKPYYFDPDKVYFGFVDNKSPQGFNFKEDYLVSKKNLDPIGYGCIMKGWVSFVVPIKKEEFMKNGTKFTLIISDVFKRKYKIKSIFKEGERGMQYFPISGISF